MCDEKTVDRIVASHATPKWMHNLLTVIGTLTVALLVTVLSTVLDNQSEIQKSEVTVLKQFDKMRQVENTRHQMVSVSMATILADAQRMEEVNNLRCSNINDSIEGLKNELQREIRNYHPASLKVR